MATFDYNNILVNVVYKNLIKFGNDITLQKNNTEDVWSKKFDSIESRNYWENNTTGKIVYTQPEIDILSYEIKALQDSFSKSELNNDLIKITDIKLYLVPDVEPQKDDIITKDDIDYKIYYVEKIKPADVTLMYIVYIRN